MAMKFFLVFFLIHSIISVKILEGIYSEYETNEIIPIKARKISSTQGLPYSYYSLPVCKEKEVKEYKSTIGEHFFGDRLFSTPFKVEMKKDIKCQLLGDLPDIECPKIKKEDLEILAERISNRYKIEFEIDNLPSADLTIFGGCGNDLTHGTKTGDDVAYRDANGFLLGCKLEREDESNDYSINNHFRFNIKYHERTGSDLDTPRYSIVAFEVYPSSIKHTRSKCHPNLDIPEEERGKYISISSLSTDDSIPWSYSVTWEESSIEWSSRWDNYIHFMEIDGDDSLTNHWFSLINSVLIVVFLSGVVATIMISILKKDINRSRTNLDESDDIIEETSWKQINGEVFRPPFFNMMFSICTGSGIQLLVSLLVILFGALIGILSPANRGGLLKGLIVICALLSILGGYTSLRNYKLYEGTRWKTTVFFTASFFPGILFSIIAVGNLVIKLGTDSTIPIPFLSLLQIFLIVVGVSTPLTFLGGYFGFKRESISLPCKVRKIPKPILKQPWYFSSIFQVLFGGLFPFGSIFIELYFVFSSIWFNMFYYLFGFLFLVFIIFFLTSSLITIVLIYFQLCAENWRWKWKSFFIAGSSSFYFFLYSIYFYFNSDISDVFLTLIYFTYSIIISVAFFLASGSIGYFAGFWFVRKIYASIRID